MGRRKGYDRDKLLSIRTEGGSGDRGGEAPPVFQTCAVTGAGVDALVADLLERVGASTERAD